jgi:hypothetical protein
MSVGPITHAARANIYQEEARWRLGPDALEREGGERAKAPWWARLSRAYLMLLVPWALDRIEKGGPARFPYRSIKELRLTFEPVEPDDTRHKCEVKLVNGERASIYSVHFDGVNSSQDRAGTYVPLVHGLIARIAATNPECRFWSGKPALVYWLQIGAILVLLLALLAVLAFLTGFELSDLALLKLAVIVGFIPVMYLYVRKNKPQQFDPAGIPEDALPKP